ncbi:MAG: hypothetical protein HKL96_12630 [Phycisphaerales bacterium]|nr:hypothetical protein [Phycisphaerales bacterium]
MPPPIPKPPPAQLYIRRFNIHAPCITALAVSVSGRLWFGTEGQGIVSYNPKAPTARVWQHFTSRDNAPNNVYALACDRDGRVWAGSLNHGVCVYNGRSWRDYAVAAGLGYRSATHHGVGQTHSAHYPAIGPLGSRIFAIAISPLDASVWLATNRGLSRYNTITHAWQYYTTANGLPANALSCLAFTPDGKLFVGTQCHGLAISGPASHYAQWIHVRGPDHLLTKPRGSGLPSNLINCVLIARNPDAQNHHAYTVYVGTDGGLAWSKNAGRSFIFLRGRNYADKVRGMWHRPLHWQSPSAHLLTTMLSSDYVTCLAQATNGDVWIGHRATGFDVLNTGNNNIRQSFGSRGTTHIAGFVASLLALPGNTMMIGGYEDGLFERVTLESQAMHPPTKPAANATPPPFPASAKPPTASQIQQLITLVKRGQGPATAAASFGQDWQTQGDWLGRYGVNFARLCAGKRNFVNDEERFFGGLAQANIQRLSSPHQNEGDVAYYLSWTHSQLRRTLFFPDASERIEGEWNDAGGRYNRFYQGPDMWLRVAVPRGLYKVSFYFHNKDGQYHENALRDFVAKVYRGLAGPRYAWLHEKPLARSRVMQFWGGVYVSFILKGPHAYLVRLQRNNGFWMPVQGMFMDRLAGPKLDAGYTNLDGLPITNYRPPNLPPKPTPALAPALQLWQLLSEPSSYSTTDLALQWPMRVLAYRYMQANHASDQLLQHCRWKLCLWQPSDRRKFNAMMAELANRP